MKSPVLLAPDNFTPITRTPWAGLDIGRSYKKDLVAGSDGKKIGESWEFSCDPDFPSKVMGSDLNLIEFVAKHGEEVLSPKLCAGKTPTCEILVKLLNPSIPLSLQVHPEDGDKNLKEGECGKPESWLVLSAEENAGLYLGFSKSVTRDELREALKHGDSAKELLHFVPVKAGDYFEIAPGVSHAIGPGVTLLEPQRILFGQSGKTYRLWDWGRKYNDQGDEDPVNGKPRELHLESGLALVDPENHVGANFVDSLRREAEVRELSSGVTAKVFPTNSFYQTIMIAGSKGSSCEMNISDGYGALIVLSGAVTSGSTVMKTGQPSILPHAAMPVSLTFDNDSEIALVIPEGASFS